MPESIPTLKSARQEKEKKLNKEGQDIPFPGWEKLDAEKRQKKPEIRISIKDAQGNLVNTIKGEATKGIHRLSWNLQYASKMGIKLEGETFSWAPMATPGTYSASLSKVVDGEVTNLSPAESFELKPLRSGALEGASYEAMKAYKSDLEAFQQDFMASSVELDKSLKRIKAMQKAILQLDRESNELETRIHQAEQKLLDLNSEMNGSPSANEVGESRAPAVGQRLYSAANGLMTTYGPTQTHKQTLETGKSELAKIKLGLTEIVDVLLPQLEKELKEAGAPWIEGQGLIKDN